MYSWVFGLCWECLNLLNQLSKIALEKKTKKELTFFVKVPISPSVAPLLGNRCTLAATFSAPPIPILSRPHPLHKKSQSIMSSGPSLQIMWRPSIVQVQNGGCNSLQGNFLLRNRRKTFFVSLLTLFQIQNWTWT